MEPGETIDVPSVFETLKNIFFNLASLQKGNDRRDWSWVRSGNSHLHGDKRVYFDLILIFETFILMPTHWGFIGLVGIEWLFFATLLAGGYFLCVLSRKRSFRTLKTVPDEESLAGNAILINTFFEICSIVLIFATFNSRMAFNYNGQKPFFRATAPLPWFYEYTQFGASLWSLEVFNPPAFIRFFKVASDIKPRFLVLI